MDDNFIGNCIETPDDACLAECRKFQNKDRNLLADVRRIQQADLEVQGGFIVGFDHDQPSIFQRQIGFIQQSGIVTAMVGLLQAPPGTRLHERMRNEGRLRGQSSGDNVNGTTNILPKMDLDVLRQGYRNILRHILPPSPAFAPSRDVGHLWLSFPENVRPPCRLAPCAPKVSFLKRAAEPDRVAVWEIPPTATRTMSMRPPLSTTDASPTDEALFPVQPSPATPGVEAHSVLAMAAISSGVSTRFRMRRSPWRSIRAWLPPLWWV